MEEILREGKKCGFEFNNGKLEVLRIDSVEEILGNFGRVVNKKDSSIYLRSLV